MTNRRGIARWGRGAGYVVVIALLTKTLTACSVPRTFPDTVSRPAAQGVVKEYLATLKAGRCADAFAMGVPPRSDDGALLSEAAFTVACTRHPLTDFTVKNSSNLVWDGWASVFADLTYAEVKVEDRIPTKGRLVQHNTVRLTLSPKSGPLLDPRIDGFPVETAPVDGCPPGCTDKNVDATVFAGPHTLTAAAGPWTEPITMTLPPDSCRLCGGIHTMEIRPTLTPAGKAAARRAAERCLDDDGCGCNRSAERGRSVTVTGDAVPQNNGVFNMPLGWRVEVPARVACADGPRNKTFVVVLPLKGPPEVDMVFDAR